MAGTGFELTQDNGANSSDAVQGGAKSGALGPQTSESDPRLLAIIEAWPALSEAVRDAVLAIVRSGLPVEG